MKFRGKDDGVGEPLANPRAASIDTEFHLVLLWIFRSIAGQRRAWEPLAVRLKKACCWLALASIANSFATAQDDEGLVGVWESDQGFRTYQLLVRSDGRYQLDSKSTDPIIDLSSTERGFYQVEGLELILTTYDYLVRPDSRRYQFERSENALQLTSTEFGLSQTQLFQRQPGSREAVLAREQVVPTLVRTWRRHVPFYGDVECTFRPGGYYAVKQTPDNPQFATENSRGRYELAGNQLTLRPYSEKLEIDEMDFFGNELTLIMTDDFSRQSATFEAVPGSEMDVPVKAAEADAFLARTNWQVGVWEIREGQQSVDLTLRPDGRYAAETVTSLGKEIVRGRYTLDDARRIHLIPYIGQDLYSRSGGEFGNGRRLRQLDYYDGQLQFIDLEAITQSVTTAQKRPGSDAAVTKKVVQAQGEQAEEGWWIGVWEVDDAAGWMEFTFRPDQHYIAKAGAGGVPKQVERGRYRLGANKLTLVPYPNLGEAGGFETDFYDGTWLLISDPHRMVVARKIPGSEVTVAEATRNPDALKGAGAPLVGLWTVQLNGYAADLIFRPDGQFRLVRCAKGHVTREYGLYSVDLPARALVLDSRLAELETARLDLYGASMTLSSTNQGFPVTYLTNPAQAADALQASFAADAAEAKLSALWLDRVPIGPVNPDVGEVPPLPVDFRPEHVLAGATVFTEYRHYQRPIPSYVNFEWGTVPVVNLEEWHFLRSGRVLIRFTQYVSGGGFPDVVPKVISVWGAYEIKPNRASQDILHLYADNSLRVQTDEGEELELTLEGGRRYLFWGRHRAALDEWAAEEEPILCQPPETFDPSLLNTGISLQTTIPPDDLAGSIDFSLARSVAGGLSIQGTSSSSATLVTEQATQLTPPIQWQSLQTNAVPGGPFDFAIPVSTNAAAYYRLREQ